MEMHANTPSITDSELLREYNRGGGQPAFGALVERYQSMVLGTAYRRTGDVEMARDVAQEVFAALARKAGLLIGRPSVGGWLHQATVFQSMRAVQAETRQRVRDRRFADEADAFATSGAADAAMAQQWSILDETIDALPAPDREAIVLHYFQDLSYCEMAGVLGTNEPAVRKRVSRALERLGTRLRERGVGSDVAVVLAGAVAIQATLPVPVALAQAALALAAAGGGSSAFLTLTAILSHGTVKTAVTILAVATLPVLWETAAPAPAPMPPAQVQAAARGEMPPLPVATSPERVVIRRPSELPAASETMLAEARSTNTAAGAALTRRVPATRSATEAVAARGQPQLRAKTREEDVIAQPSRDSSPRGRAVLAAAGTFPQETARRASSGDREVSSAVSEARAGPGPPIVETPSGSGLDPPPATSSSPAAPSTGDSGLASVPVALEEVPRPAPLVQLAVPVQLPPLFEVPASLAPIPIVDLPPLPPLELPVVAELPVLPELPLLAKLPALGEWPSLIQALPIPEVLPLIGAPAFNEPLFPSEPLAANEPVLLIDAPPVEASPAIELPQLSELPPLTEPPQLVLAAALPELRRVELIPEEAAVTFAEILTEVLGLVPPVSAKVEEVLWDHFEDLNLAGLAGPKPEILPVVEWVASREPILTAAVESVQEILVEVAPQLPAAAPDIVEKVLTLIDEADPVPAIVAAATPLAVLLEPEALVPAIEHVAAAIPTPRVIEEQVLPAVVATIEPALPIAAIIETQILPEVLESAKVIAPHPAEVASAANEEIQPAAAIEILPVLPVVAPEIAPVEALVPVEPIAAAIESLPSLVPAEIPPPATVADPPSEPAPAPAPPPTTILTPIKKLLPFR